jgi:hypothetical protein
MKQTAVDWLLEQVNNKGWGDYMISIPVEVIEQAKEMEKEQMIDFAFNFYYDFCNKTGVPFNLISENRINAEDYYNETFNNDEK